MSRTVILLFVLLSSLGCARVAPHPAELSFAPITFTPPEVEKIVLPNGIRLYLKEDHELPLIEISALVGSGSIHDPADKTGLAELLARTLRTGGAGERSPADIDGELERLAADFYVSADTYALNLGLSLHRRDLAAGIAILSDTLRRPLFDPERLELARRQKIEEVRRQNDRPQGIAPRLLMAEIYGDHPLGRTPTTATLAAITRDDLQMAAKSVLTPGNLWLAISGDFRRDELLQHLAGALGDWSPAKADSSIPALTRTEPRQQTVVVDKDIPQTVIMLGELGIAKDAPDLPALRVMNFILGGGSFNSRLVQEIRNDRGLAYSVYSHFQVGRRLPGPFIVQCETKNSSVGEVVKLIRTEMEKMRREEVTADELRVAKESLINSFVFSFTSSHDIVAQALRLDYFGYPADYLQTFRDRIAAVTPHDVRTAAREHLHPAKQILILVGNDKELTQNRELFDGAVRRTAGEGGR